MLARLKNFIALLLRSVIGGFGCYFGNHIFARGRNGVRKCKYCPKTEGYVVRAKK